MSSDDQYDSKSPPVTMSGTLHKELERLADTLRKAESTNAELLEENARLRELNIEHTRNLSTIAAAGGDPQTVLNLIYEREEAERNYKGACKTIAEMWTAATGKEGEGPQVGVIQDVRQVRLDRDRFEAASKECLRKYDQKVTEFFKVSDEKNHAYWERNQLVVALSKLFPASLERHSGAGWDDDWRWLVMIVFPTGQGSWHIHDSELEFFDHLPRQKMIAWDGHTAAEKYLRLQMLEPKT